VSISEKGERLRRRVGAAVVDGFFHYASQLGKLHPQSRPARHGVEVIRDVVYGDHGRREHRLDVYKPIQPGAGLKPAVLYLHGGGFRILSKDTHWIMALAYARRGYVVFNVDYRLAPDHRFPCAVEDACDAYAWVVEHAHEYGADAQRLVLAGESAGANLSASLALAACWERDEACARKVYATGVVPRVVVAACGIHQVSDPQRFARRKASLSRMIADRIEEVADAYLGDDAGAHPPELLDLADPLLAYERGTRPSRDLPAFFLPCGTADPVLDDTRRLHAALEKLGARTEARYYRGEPHAFHAFVVRESARQCWADTYSFLDRHL
jgi:acetyl esterase